MRIVKNDAIGDRLDRLDRVDQLLLRDGQIGIGRALLGGRRVDAQPTAVRQAGASNLNHASVGQDVTGRVVRWDRAVGEVTLHSFRRIGRPGKDANGDAMARHGDHGWADLGRIPGEPIKVQKPLVPHDQPKVAIDDRDSFADRIKGSVHQAHQRRFFHASGPMPLRV